MKAIFKALLRQTPYRVIRGGSNNRFDAIEDVLNGLRSRGFSPTIIIDGGANIGNFTLQVKRFFPRATVHLIEPQPACYEALAKFSPENGFYVHRYALVSSSGRIRNIHLAIDPNAVTTGAHITFEKDAHSIEVPTVTVDELLANHIKSGNEYFIKLDLQGFELEALAGAENTLKKTEVILTEVSFYAQAYEPPIENLIRFLDERGFSLYDVASLYGRPRDGRARQGDFVFVRRDSPLMADRGWS